MSSCRTRSPDVPQGLARYDPFRFIKRYLPQLTRLNGKTIHAPWRTAPLELQAAGIVLGENYPRPVVEHDVARKKTLERYGVVRTPRDDLPRQEAEE